MGCPAKNITNNAYDVTRMSRALQAVSLLDMVDHEQECTADHNHEVAEVILGRLDAHAETSKTRMTKPFLLQFRERRNAEQVQ